MSMRIKWLGDAAVLDEVVPDTELVTEEARDAWIGEGEFPVLDTKRGARTDDPTDGR